MLRERFERLIRVLLVLLCSLAIMGCISWGQAFVLSFANLQRMVDDTFGPPKDVTVELTETAAPAYQSETDTSQFTGEDDQESQVPGNEELAGTYEGTAHFPPFCEDCPGATMRVIDNRVQLTVEADGSVHGEIRYSNEESWTDKYCSTQFSRGISGALTGNLSDAEGQLQAHLVRSHREEQSGHLICTPEYEWTSESDLGVVISITNGTMLGVEQICAASTNLEGCFYFEAARHP